MGPARAERDSLKGRRTGKAEQQVSWRRDQFSVVSRNPRPVGLRYLPVLAAV
jgi:hypothetical protein